MQHLRSRAGTVATAAGAVVLLSLPVVALAKGPPELVGGGTDTASGVASPQANVPNPPPGQLHNSDQASKPPSRPHPTAQAPAQAPADTAAPAPAGQGPAVRAPGSGRAPDSSGPARRGPVPGLPVQHGPNKGAPPPAGPAQDPVSAEPEEGNAGGPNPGDEPSRSDSPNEPDPTGALELPRADTPGAGDDTGGEAVAAVPASETVELPDDASPETLPFTGLQLALMAMTGLAAIAAGAALRRRLQRRRA